MSDRSGFYEAPKGKPSPGNPASNPTEAPKTMPAGKITTLNPSPGGSEVYEIKGPGPSKDMV